MSTIDQLMGASRVGVRATRYRHHKTRQEKVSAQKKKREKMRTKLKKSDETMSNNNKVHDSFGRHFPSGRQQIRKKKTQNRKNFLHHENETKAIHTLTAIESDRTGGQDTVERTSQ